MMFFYLYDKGQLNSNLPNALAHREPPRRTLSVSSEPQQGGDAVERNVRRRARLLP